jgi:8-oxo-dGTP diphosphatase
LEAEQVFRLYQGPVGENPARFCMACGSPCIDVNEGGHSHRACGSGGRPHWRTPSPTVSVLVVERERLLLCLREERMFRGGKWCVPGGYMEFDEDFLTAGRREVREETGLEVRIKSILSVASTFYVPDTASLNVTLLAEPVGGVLEARDETDVVRWHPFAEDLPEMAFPHHEHIIRRYFETGLAGAPVDPRFAAGVFSDEARA